VNRTYPTLSPSSIGMSSCLISSVDFFRNSWNSAALAFGTETVALHSLGIVLTAVPPESEQSLREGKD
jgi:hypothetical protein